MCCNLGIDVFLEWIEKPSMSFILFISRADDTQLKLQQVTMSLLQPCCARDLQVSSIDEFLAVCIHLLLWCDLPLQASTSGLQPSPWEQPFGRDLSPCWDAQLPSFKRNSIYVRSSMCLRCALIMLPI